MAGITPACAGKSPSWNWHSMRPWGSPPLARGKDGPAAGRGISGGITPACAGKSYATLLIRNRNEDHPRLRGEKLLEPLLDLLVVGSPPLARGKVFAPFCKPPWWRDRPRLRGEKSSMARLRSGIRGSPPLARGKVQPRHDGVRKYGITPACAGKSARKPCCPSACRDHPRLRGEKKSLIWERSSRIGSPPLARGKA